MTPIRVIVADDEPEIAARMKRRVEAAASGVLADDVTALSGEELQAVIRELRRREGETATKEGWSPRQYNHVIDEADVVILDFDMSNLYGRSAYMTGEIVASLARRYSQAGVIVSVNRFGGPHFDLRLRSYGQAWADLSIAHQDLENPGLWVHGLADYRPWYWPILSELPELFSSRVQFAYDHRDQFIAEALNIPDFVLKVIPNEVYDRLPDIRRTTFLELAQDFVFPPKAPRPSMKQMVRSAAAEVSKWLLYSVLPGQETLLDAPHLVSLYPSLLTSPQTQDNLNALCSVHVDADLPLAETNISEQRFQQTAWVDRPVWWTEKILESNQLQENNEPWTKKELAYVFAEDTSDFRKRDLVTPFRADGLLKRRYVARPSESESYVDYRPAGRLVD